jgi:hypothetical protein
VKIWFQNFAFKYSLHRYTEGADAEREQVLMMVEAFPDGSIALSPDFTKDGDGENYRIERRDGSVYEYSVTNASKRDEVGLYELNAVDP